MTTQSPKNRSWKEPFGYNNVMTNLVFQIIVGIIVAWLIRDAIFSPKNDQLEPIPIHDVTPTNTPTYDIVVENDENETAENAMTLPMEEVWQLEATVTNTKETILPTATPNAVAPTNTPVPPSQAASEAISVVAQEEAVIYAGPSADAIQALGVLKKGQIAEAVGRTSYNDWVELTSPAGVTGWVESEKLLFTIGQVNELDVTWPRTGTSTATSEDSCLNVNIEMFDLPNKHFDNIEILWDHVPSDAHTLKLIVSGNIDGESAYLVYPENVTPSAQIYTIGYWMFSERGFVDNTTFHYSLQALDVNGNEICIEAGSFTN